jgi:multicomponent Na+:H+ antiporter subunit D
MVVGVGIGTAMAINGTVAHAFCHLLYKSLLFMSMGALLYRTGTIKATELGGLYRTMPWTAACCLVGAASISAFPLFSGFISKSLILSALAEEHYYINWLLLLVASAGVMEHSGIKIPFFAFFGHDSGKRPEEAPRHMLIAMGITAALCVILGVAYPMLYALLPYDVEYHPYTTYHVVTQLQLLMFSALAFLALMKSGLYPPEVPSENLDFDWTYRRLVPAVLVPTIGWGSRSWGFAGQAVTAGVGSVLRGAGTLLGQQGLFGRSWSTSVMATWAAILLATYLLLYYS